MATGENFMRIHSARRDANRPKLKVDKKTEFRTRSQIETLAKERDALYENLDITDEELKILCLPINDNINRLINSMY